MRRSPLKPYRPWVKRKDTRDRTEYRKLNSAKMNAASIEWAKNNPEKRKIIMRKANYMKNYGITPAEVELMLKNQDDKCLICEDLITLGGRTGAHVDHCHELNEIRGILCQKCNIGLGAFKDNTVILFNAINYLREFRRKKFTLVKKSVPTEYVFVNPFEKVG